MFELAKTLNRGVCIAVEAKATPEHKDGSYFFKTRDSKSFNCIYEVLQFVIEDRTQGRFAIMDTVTGQKLKL